MNAALISQKSHSCGMRVIRATLYHLSGETSEIFTITPIYTEWSDPCEKGAMLLDEYVKQLTRFTVAISKFVVEIGSIGVDGQFTAALSYTPQHVPTDKYYLSGKRGEWGTSKQVEASYAKIRREANRG